MNTLTFVIAFIVAANKSAFYDFGVQRRKAAKIFACFLSGQIWAKNMTRATALNKTSIMSEIRVELHLNDFGKFGNKSISQKELDVRCQLTNPWSEKTLLALSEITAIFFSPDIKRCLSINFTISSRTSNSQRNS